jgi:hypothetical protein
LFRAAGLTISIKSGIAVAGTRECTVPMTDCLDKKKVVQSTFYLIKEAFFEAPPAIVDDSKPSSVQLF